MGSISNASDYKLWYSFGMIFHFARVLHIMVLKGNILVVIVRIFHFGMVLQSGNDISCYFTFEGVEVLELKYWDIIGISKVLGLRWDCSSSVMYPHLLGCHSFSQCLLFLLLCQFNIIIIFIHSLSVTLFTE